VALKWLGEQPPQLNAGVSWGVPWPKTTVVRGMNFGLSAQGADGQARPMPIQSWPLAYWPDGSVKWSGFATVAPAELAGEVTLTVTGAVPPAAVGVPLKVVQDGKTVAIDTGAVQCAIPVAGGTNLFDSMTIEGRGVVGAGQLVCV
jgi:hypothetical protein